MGVGPRGSGPLSAQLDQEAQRALASAREVQLRGPRPARCEAEDVQAAAASGTARIATVLVRDQRETRPAHALESPRSGRGSGLEQSHLDAIARLGGVRG